MGVPTPAHGHKSLFTTLLDHPAHQVIDDQIEYKRGQEQPPPGHLHPDNYKESIEYTQENVGHNQRNDNAG